MHLTYNMTMTAKEAAQKWKMSLSSVYDYLKNGLIEGAYKNENGHWIIQDDSLKPYRIHSNSFLTEEKIYKHILVALNNRQSISQSQLESDVDDYFYVLEESGNITKLKNKNENDFFKAYKPTQQGLNTLKSQTKLIELVRLAIDLLKLV